MTTTEAAVIRQRPAWPDEHLLETVSSELRNRDGLVPIDEVRQLRQLVADASFGRALLLQYGDCAEPVLDEPSDYVASFLSLRDTIHQAASSLSSRPIVHIGRIAGQYAKPRSSDYDQIEGVAMYAYRGDMVNSAEPDHRLRVPDPYRLLRAHECAKKVMNSLSAAATAKHLTARLIKDSLRPNDQQSSARVYTSHEALILEYERPFVRMDQCTQATYSSSAHMLWVGDRTRSLASAHVALLSEICNPVGIKVGPNFQIDELIAIIHKLNPFNSLGRVALIVRLGAKEIGRKLPILMGEVKKRGFQVAWMCDPMHGNTRRLPDGRKYRWMKDILSEIHTFADVARSLNLSISGIHLEASADAVGECINVADQLPMGAIPIASNLDGTRCDPRMSSEQAVIAVKYLLAYTGDLSSWS
jgi:3-deoxy-7-phosphoheptulonate synthase